MNTRDIAEEYRLSHWAGIMRKRAESGLSITAYCKSAGFHANVYYYWQRKLREAAYEQITSTAQESSIVAVPGGWALCETAKPETLEKPVTIEVGKFRIIATVGIDSEHLLQICRTLLSLC